MHPPSPVLSSRVGEGCIVLTEGKVTEIIKLSALAMMRVVQKFLWMLRNNQHFTKNFVPRAATLTDLSSKHTGSLNGRNSTRGYLRGWRQREWLQYCVCLSHGRLLAMCTNDAGMCGPLRCRRKRYFWQSISGIRPWLIFFLWHEEIVVVRAPKCFKVRVYQWCRN